jgi:hypothetical protein
MNAKTSEPAVPNKVTRADIEAKLRELRGDIDERVGNVKVTVAVIGVAVATAAIVAAYWLGRRQTRRRQTVFEIRRI